MDTYQNRNQQPSFWDKFSGDQQTAYKTNIFGSQRQDFIKKVFSIVFVQILVTTIITGFTMGNVTMRRFVMESQVCMIISVIGALVTMLILLFSDKMAKQVPTNYYLLTAFTLFESYSIACLCNFTDPEIVLMALVGTCAITLTLVTYAMTAKKDFTIMGSFVHQMISSMFIMAISNFFFRIPLIGCILYAGSCVMAGLYLIYDVQMICGGKRGKFGIDDYVRAAMTLYLDIIRIFIKIIQILNALKKDDDEKDRKK